MRAESKPHLNELAAQVDGAAVNALPIEQLSRRHSFSLEDAYEIQRLSIDLRLDRGETITGIKMGFTSRAKRRQMGVEEMIFGHLTDAMLVDDGGDMPLSRCIHPRAEPEVAFLMKKPLGGMVSPAQAMAAVEAVAPAIEIIDSRYRDFKFTLEDVVADNCSSSGYVLGSWCSPATDISNLGIVFQFDGRPVDIGSSAAILGHPARSLAAASRLLGRYGLMLEPGWVVMAGSATAAFPLRGNVHVLSEVEALGQVGFLVDQ